MAQNLQNVGKELTESTGLIDSPVDYPLGPPFRTNILRILHPKTLLYKAFWAMLMLRVGFRASAFLEIFAGRCLKLLPQAPGGSCQCSLNGSFKGPLRIFICRRSSLSSFQISFWVLFFCVPSGFP